MFCLRCSTGVTVAAEVVLLYLLLHPFQNVGRFDIFGFIYFVMDLDICYI